MNENLHSPQRQLIELRMELGLRRRKKRRLLLRDQIARLEVQVDPPEPA
jgi:hypothetical protein